MQDTQPFKMQNISPKKRPSRDPSPQEVEAPFSLLPNIDFSGNIFFLMVTLKLNMAHV